MYTIRDNCRFGLYTQGIVVEWCSTIDQFNILCTSPAKVSAFEQRANAPLHPLTVVKVYFQSTLLPVFV